MTKNNKKEDRRRLKEDRRRLKEDRRRLKEAQRNVEQCRRFEEDKRKEEDRRRQKEDRRKLILLEDQLIYLKLKKDLCQILPNQEKSLMKRLKTMRNMIQKDINN